MPSQEPYRVLLPLIREHLYPPDGKPPATWDERREGSVIKQMLRFWNVSQIEVAILGLARLRDTGQIDWLKPGAKVTLRALYHTRSGVCQMFELATAEYWRVAKHRPKKRPDRSVGEILESAIRQGEFSERYKRYLQSPEWRAKRAQVLARAAERCERCDDFGVMLEVHHLRYNSLGFEPLEDLEALCERCHNRADAERRGDAA